MKHKTVAVLRDDPTQSKSSSKPTQEPQTINKDIYINDKTEPTEPFKKGYCYQRTQLSLQLESLFYQGIKMKRTKKKKVRKLEQW